MEGREGWEGERGGRERGRKVRGVGGREGWEERGVGGREIGVGGR